MWGHIVMKSRTFSDPELSLNKVPERIIKMYPNGDKILYVFKKLDAYNKEKATVSDIRRIISNGSNTRNARTNVKRTIKLSK